MGLKNNNELERIKLAFNRVLNEHIERNKLQEVIESITSMNLGNIINIYEAISENLLNNDKGRHLIKDYIKVIKENKDLKTVYSFYNFINNVSIDDSYDLFLNEAVSCIDNINMSNYNNGVKTLSNIVCEGVKAVNLKRDEINNIINNNSNNLYDDVEFILLNKKNFKNINEHITHKNNIIKHLKEHKKNQKVVYNENNLTNKELIESFNKEVAEINEEWLKFLIEDITLNNLSSNKMNTLFESYKTECINIINDIINGNVDIVNKSKMMSMKEGLEKKQYNDESFYTDIINLAELKNTLKESAYEN